MLECSQCNGRCYCMAMSLTGAQKSVRSGTTPSALVISTSNMTGLVCPKCGTTKKSGRRSCCARGGSWFKNCGDARDPNFDHTWPEGIRSCKGKLRET